MKTNKNSVAPRLRFPEFQGDEGWERSEFNKVYALKITNSLSRDKLNYVKGNIKNIHYGDIHTKFSALFDVEKEHVPFINEQETNYKSETGDFCIEGDIVLADASEDIKDIGKSIEIINIANQKIVCGLHTIHARPKKNKLHIGFGAYLFQSHFIRTQIQLESQGAKVLGLSKGRLDKIDLLLPKTDEQQKIADCLSSLDTLMKAESKQLDVLKEYKAGLLQQLFPVEGETMPKLRFAEFEGGEDWEEVSLNDLAKFRRGSFPQPYGLAKWYDDKNGMPFVQVYDVSDNLKLKSTTKRKISKLAAELSVFIPKGTLIITIQGSIGRVAITQYDAYIDRTLLIFQQFFKSVDKFFFAYVLQLLFYIEKQKAPGGIIKTITKEALSSFKIYLPDIDEQQKIANCLSSLDNLIQAKDNQINALKEHKQGLMQQLFPVMDDK